MLFLLLFMMIFNLLLTPGEVIGEWWIFSVTAVKAGLGANGVWLTIALTMVLTNGIFCILYRQKKWLKIKI